MNTQVTEIRVAVNGTNHDVRIQNMDVQPVEEWNFEPRRSIGGVLRANGARAGKKFRISLDYDGSIQPDEWDDMINDMYQASIYDNDSTVKLYPDTSSTSDTAVAFYGDAFSAVDDEITIATHNIEQGLRVKYDDSNVTIGGLTDGNFYYVYVQDANVFSLTNTINKEKVDLTSRSGTGNFLYEVAYMDMIPVNLDEAMKYTNTIGRFRPSLELESVYRYVVTPTAFKNV